MKILPFLFINVTADYWLFLLNRTKLFRSIIAWILAFISICQKLSQTKDKILIKCHPSNVTWDDYVEDCNLAVNIVDINSDEYSAEEEELARKERSDEKRPENICSTNSVIKICDKPWRSTRVCNNVCEIVKE